MIIRHVMYGVCKRRKQETAKTVLDDILSERDVLKLLRTYGFFLLSAIIFRKNKECAKDMRQVIDK